MMSESKKSNPPLNKPMRGDTKKYKVFVKDPDTGKIKKVNFGDPDMEIRRDNPERRKSFRARHKCDTAKDKTTARYWSCKFWDKTPVSKMLEGIGDIQLSKSQDEKLKGTAVARNGKPIPVFHGTMKKFSKLKRQASERNEYGNGIYFTESGKEASDDYASFIPTSKYGTVHIAFLNIKNPCDVTNPEHGKKVMAKCEAVEWKVFNGAFYFKKKLNFDFDEVMATEARTQSGHSDHPVSPNDWYVKLQQYLMDQRASTKTIGLNTIIARLGFDGIHVPANKWWIAFKESQVVPAFVKESHQEQFYKNIEEQMSIKPRSNGPHFFSPKGVFNPFKLLDENKKVTRSGVLKTIDRVKDEGRISGYSKHEINDETMYATSKDKRASRLIDDALVDVGVDRKIPYWQMAAYIDSPDVVSDLDTLAGIILDLEKSGDEFHLKKDIDVYDEAYAIFKKGIPAYISSVNDKQKGYLRDLWQEDTEHISEMSDQDVAGMPVFKIINYIMQKKIKRADVEAALEKLKAYAKLDALNKALGSMEADGLVFEKKLKKVRYAKS